MRILTTIFLFLSFFAQAQNKRVYVANAGANSGTGLTTGAPFATINYAVSQCNPYDTVTLNRGDNFSEDVYLDPATRHHLVLEAYGIGANPKFNGWQVATGWTNNGNGTWSYTNSGLPKLPAVVQLDGYFKPMARFPRTGFKTISKPSNIDNIPDADSLKDYTLTNSPNYTGALIVSKKVRWVLDVGYIKSHVDSLLVFTNVDGNAYGYANRDGYGYFLMNHPSFLTQFGDWCWDTATRKITMYFGTETPSNHVIKIGKIDRAMNISAPGVKMSNIDFEGYNKWGIIANADSLSWTNCGFSFIGIDAIEANSGQLGYKILNCNFHHNPVNNVTGQTGSDGWTVTGNTSDSTGAWWGAIYGSNDNKQMAFVIHGDNLKFKFNNIKNFGYEALYFRGSGCEVDSSYYDNFCFIKDDGGAIYTFNGDSSVTTGAAFIRGNVIQNGIGVAEGVSPTDYTNEGVTTKARAIYLDEDVNHVTISGNTVLNCLQDNSAIFLHNTHDIAITGNTFYKNKRNIHIRTFRPTPAYYTHDVTVTNNIMVNQPSRFQVLVDQAASSLAFGTINNNKYYSQDTTATNFQTKIQNFFVTDRTFASWKAAITGDAASNNNLYTTEQLLINGTGSPSVKPLTGFWKDVAGTIYSSSITVAPYSSAFLQFYVPPAGTSTGIKLMMRTVNGKVKILTTAAGNLLFKE